MERNRETLRKALSQLPEYTPPDQMWEGIADGLESKEELSLQDRLPAYSPPPMVWNQINQALEADNQHKPALIRRLGPVLRIAAAVVITGALGAFLLMREPAPKVALTYSQEAITPIAINVDWQQEEPQFEAILQQLQQHSANPKLNEMRLELEELNSAKKEVTTILTAYGGKDPALINQLGEIERERSALYRELIKLI